MKDVPYKLVNLDRQNALQLMGEPTPQWDRGVVYSTTETEPNILTREPQPKALFWGTVSECQSWIAARIA